MGVAVDSAPGIFRAALRVLPGKYDIFPGPLSQTSRIPAGIEQAGLIRHLSLL